MNIPSIDLETLDHKDLANLVTRATAILTQRVLAGHAALAALDPLTTEEAAPMIGVTPQHLRRMCAKGQISHFRVGGGSYAIPRATAAAIAASRTPIYYEAMAPTQAAA